MNKVSSISKYIDKIDLKDIDSLKFLIEDTIRTNPYHQYIVRKIISQLGVRNHIHLMGPALKTNRTEDIFGQIVHNENPLLMKKLIEKADLELELTCKLYKNNLSPFFQILSIDYNKIEELKLKKRTIFDKIRAKFGRTKSFDETQIYGNKKTKIIQCYYIIPEKIEKKEKELANLKWNDVKRRKLKKEIKELRHKKNEYYDSILKWYSSDTSKKEDTEQIEKLWQEYYLKHEREMLEWIDYEKAGLNPNISENDRIAFLISYCEDYFRSIDSFNSKVEILKQDITNNVEVIKTVFGKEYKNARLSEILQELRTSMDGKLMQKGMTGYRIFDIPTNGADRFFTMSSKGKDVKSDMQQLGNEYEELKKIEDREEYINKAIYIFQRFIQIHPYVDGNGRTSRALLDIMLINRDIVPPVLYDTYYQSGKLDSLSMEYLQNGNKKPLQDYIKEQINKAQLDTEGQNQRSEDKLLKDQWSRS